MYDTIMAAPIKMEMQIISAFFDNNLLNFSPCFLKINMDITFSLHGDYWYIDLENKTCPYILCQYLFLQYY